MVDIIKTISGSGRGTYVRRKAISSTQAIMILNANPNRVSLTIEAPTGNTGNIAIAFNDPAVAVTGDHQGTLVAPGGQFIESAPANGGALFIISANGTEDALVREDFGVV